jgi:hypothetical protein
VRNSVEKLDQLPQAIEQYKSAQKLAGRHLFDLC